MSVELRVEKAVAGGDGLARLDGRVVFVEGALPGELVRAELAGGKRDWLKARAVEILEPSPFRVAPACPLAGRCGGCSLQHCSAAGQLALKRGIVEDLFRRQLKRELPAEFDVEGGEPFGYRNRARVHLFRRDGRNVAGFLGRGTHRVVGIGECPVLHASLKGVFAEVAALKGASPETDVFGSDAGRFVGNGVPAVAAVRGCEYRFDTSLFFQSNVAMLERLVDWLFSRSGVRGGNLAIDLFSGVGLFAAQLEGSFDRVVAVEREPGALRWMRENLSPRAEAWTGAAEEWESPERPDLVVVDPPREGLAPSLPATLARWSPRELWYVSCDPATWARDAARLESEGFVPKELRGFDFYPQTPHLELASIWTRRRDG